MKVGLIVRLNKEGRQIRDEKMRRWKGEVIANVEHGVVLVRWYASSRCDSCQRAAEEKLWTEREEWLKEYVAPPGLEINDAA